HAYCILLTLYCVLYIFFFSSRRRHTRSKRDWSSDVCSSDLNIAMHRVVVAEQRKHGFITDETEEQYLKGIEHTLTPEKEEDDERTLRLLTLLDALVFYGDHISKYEKTLAEKYPLALAAAKKMYAEIT